MYVSKAHQVVLLDPAPILDQLYPSAPRMIDGRVLLPHTLETFKALQPHGINLPHPLLTYYDWCGGKPFHTQILTCLMLVNNPRAYVLNAMGTGKTRAALWAWDYLNRCKLAKKLLVVSPLSTTELVWAREIFQVMPHRKAVVLHASNREKRAGKLTQEADIFIINHHGVNTILPELMQCTELDSIVLDELAVYRNGSTVRNKNMRKLTSSMRWVWGMTGTPMPNAPTDVWGQCKLVTPTSVPKFFIHCRDLLMRKVGQWQWVPREGAVEMAYQMMQPSVRFTLDEVVELPPVIERTINVPLSPDQAAAYQELTRAVCVLINEHKITAVNAAAAMTKLLQISSGWVYSQEKCAVEVPADKRIEMVLELIEECERKVIVFANFRHIINGLSQILTAQDVKHVAIHGGVPHSQRNQLFVDFKNNPAIKVLLAHPTCMSHGLTLTEADTIIWYCPTPSLETYEQADARIRRVGQKHKQQIIHLQSTPVERRVYTLLRNKQRVQDKFLELFTESNGHDNGNGH